MDHPQFVKQLRRHLPAPDLLTAEQRLGSPDGYRDHTLHVEPDGSFSIIALVWRPGQRTRIHDHMTWCVFGVIQGVEHEDLFDADLNVIDPFHAEESRSCLSPKQLPLLAGPAGTARRRRWRCWRSRC